MVEGRGFPNQDVFIESLKNVKENCLSHRLSSLSSGFTDETVSLAFLMMSTSNLKKNRVQKKNTSCCRYLPLFWLRVERICWSGMVVPMTLIGRVSRKALSQMFTLSPTYLFPCGFVMAVCVILAKGKQPSLFPVLFTII